MAKKCLNISLCLLHKIQSYLMSAKWVRLSDEKETNCGQSLSKRKSQRGLGGGLSVSSIKMHQFFYTRKIHNFFNNKLIAWGEKHFFIANKKWKKYVQNQKLQGNNRL